MSDEKNLAKTLENDANIINYCCSNMNDFELIDQIELATEFHKHAERIKHIYCKYAVKDNNVDTFLLKL